MNVTEVLQLVDDLIFKHTDTHLNDLQRNTVSGLWQGQSYNEIAEEFNYKSENHVGNISRELYKKLSEVLGEDVNKQNFRWTIERIYNSPFANSLVNKNINFCPNHPPNISQKSHEQQPNEQIPYQNLRQSPKVIKFYGREEELLKLTELVANVDTRLISVLGQAGIGKSLLVKHFIDMNTEIFDAIIWKNIELYQSLDDILQEIISEISPPNNQTNIQQKTRSSLLDQCLELFTEKRCLIILDNLEKIFASQEFAGSYQTQHIDYKKFREHLK